MGRTLLTFMHLSNANDKALDQNITRLNVCARLLVALRMIILPIAGLA